MRTSFEGARVMVQSTESLDVARKYFEALCAKVFATFATVEGVYAGSLALGAVVRPSARRAAA